ncbi:hypothetical protein V4F39_11765 [Aquincola sp. MAHUQ-54]|uniref:Uncharacterized protein n=1 Tax=Aquincola agrisoli TaxID=3119538 RepID=A0AAW9QCR5_9BURK
MVSRRNFLKSTSSGALAGALPIAGALAASDAAAAEISAPGIPLSLCGLDVQSDRPFLQSIRTSRFCSPAAAQEIDLRWGTGQPQIWHGDSLIVHSRYAPAAEGALLEAQRRWPDASPDYAAFENFHGDRRAVAVGIEPGAVLVNQKKVPGAGGRSTLADLERHQLRARFVLTDWHNTGASAWALPLVAHHLPLASGKGDAGSTFLTPETLAGLEAIQRDFLARVDVELHPLLPGDQAYRDLIDPGNTKTAALYGNPLALSRILKEAGRASEESAFVQVSLSEFLGYRLPAMPRLQAFQYGAQVTHAAAMEVAQGTLDVLSSAPRYFTGCTGLSSQAESLPGNRYDFAHYAGLPNLALLSDGGFAARTLMRLHQAVPVAEGPAHAARMAAAEAFYEWSAFQQV